jgi:hypothetical protein
MFGQTLDFKASETLLFLPWPKLGQMETFY